MLLHSHSQIIGERSEQQDSIAIKQWDDNKHLLTIVADGMGGGVAGGLASKTATEIFLSSFESEIKTGAVEQALVESIQKANDEIATLIENDASLEGTGTTFLASYITDNKLYWISIGDSLLLFYRHGELKRLNADHSFQIILDAQVEEGILSPEESSRDPRRSQLFSALCGKTVPYVDLKSEPLILQSEDIVISASDGILSMPMEDMNTLLEKLAECSPEQIVKEIIDAINEIQEPGQDNTSIAVVRYKSTHKT